MIRESLFPLGTITKAEFFRKYWRQHPLHVKKWGNPLAIPFGEKAFEDLACKLERLHPEFVRRKQASVIFAQNLNLCSDWFAGLSAEIAYESSWHSVWFDGVLTRDSGSIGFHCDASDNFVLHQSGTKIWKLQDPSVVSSDALRRTMLGQEAVLDSDSLKQGCIEFVLEPGDLLYIPVLWPHHGVAEGPSLSYSVVINAETALSLLPLLYMLMADNEAWWAPMPFPQVVDPDSGQVLEIPQSLSEYVDGLLVALTSATVKSALKREWWKSRSEQLKDAAPDTPDRTPAPSTCMGSADRRNELMSTTTDHARPSSAE